MLTKLDLYTQLLGTLPTDNSGSAVRAPYRIRIYEDGVITTHPQDYITANALNINADAVNVPLVVLYTFFQKNEIIDRLYNYFNVVKAKETANDQEREVFRDQFAVNRKSAYILAYFDELNQIELLSGATRYTMPNWSLPFILDLHYLRPLNAITATFSPTLVDSPEPNGWDYTAGGAGIVFSENMTPVSGVNVNFYRTDTGEKVGTLTTDQLTGANAAWAFDFSGTPALMDTAGLVPGYQYEVESEGPAFTSDDTGQGYTITRGSWRFLTRGFSVGGSFAPLRINSLNPSDIDSQGGLAVALQDVIITTNVVGETPDIDANTSAGTATITNLSTGAVQTVNSSDASVTIGSGIITLDQSLFGEGTYRIDLDPRFVRKATDSDGRAGWYGLTSYLISFLPASGFNGPTAQGTVGQSSEFDPTISYQASPVAGDSSEFTYLWDFGDGNTSTQASGNHTYAAEDVYTVTLTVTDGNGETDTIIFEDVDIQISREPSATFTFSQAGNVVSFTDTSISDLGIQAYAWDFGDGNTSIEQNPTHTYASNGEYTVQLTITENPISGQAPRTATISRTVDTRVLGQDNAPLAQFRFSLIDTADIGGTQNLRCDNQSDPNPDTLSPIVSQSFKLYEKGSSVVLSEDLDENARFDIATAGTYTVVLTVTDAAGLSGTYERDVEFTVAGKNYLNNPSYDYDMVGRTVTFDSIFSGDTTGFTYLWDFGDGNTSTDSDPVHTYAVGGQYRVSMRAEDTNGNFEFIIKDVFVSTDVPTNPQNTAAANFTNTTSGLTVNFQNGSTGQSPITYAWDFGDGNTSTQTSPSHTYSNAGSYTVSLTATDANGSNTISRTIVVSSTGAALPVLSEDLGGTLTSDGFLTSVDGSHTVRGMAKSTSQGGITDILDPNDPVFPRRQGSDNIVGNWVEMGYGLSAATANKYPFRHEFSYSWVGSSARNYGPNPPQSIFQQKFGLESRVIETGDVSYQRFSIMFPSANNNWSNWRGVGIGTGLDSSVDGEKGEGPMGLIMQSRIRYYGPGSLPGNIPWSLKIKGGEFLYIRNEFDPIPYTNSAATPRSWWPNVRGWKELFDFSNDLDTWYHFLVACSPDPVNGYLELRYRKEGDTEWTIGYRWDGPWFGRRSDQLSVNRLPEDIQESAYILASRGPYFSTRTSWDRITKANRGWLVAGVNNISIRYSEHEFLIRPRNNQFTIEDWQNDANQFWSGRTL